MPTAGSQSMTSYRKPVMSYRFWAELAYHNPLGIPMTAEDARAWFDYVWPLYREYGYQRHRKAISRWWMRLTEREMERALELRDRIVEEARLAELEARGRALVPDDKVVAVDFASRIKSKRNV